MTSPHGRSTRTNRYGGRHLGRAMLDMLSARSSTIYQRVHIAQTTCICVEFHMKTGPKHRHRPVLARLTLLAPHLRTVTRLYARGRLVKRRI